MKPIKNFLNKSINNLYISAILEKFPEPHDDYDAGCDLYYEDREEWDRENEKMASKVQIAYSNWYQKIKAFESSNQGLVLKKQFLIDEDYSYIDERLAKAHTQDRKYKRLMKDDSKCTPPLNVFGKVHSCNKRGQLHEKE